ncbi:amidohydrolase family protein [Shinella sp. 838]|uniref:amidohydrolase family protein n=1 Tax=Shinella sp. 838 TaxID=3038164 RepID=UPI0024158050|nr:amidohydrolase family protein [Shinella sp. 838]MDG4674923.1 amidohydrolase family protein [Shinella sp. 838]
MLPAIIDAHIHWRDPLHHRYELLSDGISEDGSRGGKPAPTYLPDDYLHDAAPAAIVGVVHIEAEYDKSNPVGETRFLHDLAAAEGTHGLPMAVVGFCDLAAADAERVLAAHAAFPMIRCIRQILNRVEGRPDLCWASADHLENPNWRANYARLADYGLHFDAMCFAHQMAPLAQLAAAHPDIPLHLEHAGMPWDHSPAGRRSWAQGLHALAALPHTDVKISGFCNTMADWNVDTIRDYVLETMDIFGPYRVMFASNFPTDKAASDMATIWAAFDHITIGFSAVEREAMFAANARQAYRF